MVDLIDKYKVNRDDTLLKYVLPLVLRVSFIYYKPKNIQLNKKPRMRVKCLATGKNVD